MAKKCTQAKDDELTDSWDAAEQIEHWPRRWGGSGISPCRSWWVCRWGWAPRLPSCRPPGWTGRSPSKPFLEPSERKKEPRTVLQPRSPIKRGGFTLSTLPGTSTACTDTGRAACSANPASTWGTSRWRWWSDHRRHRRDSTTCAQPFPYSCLGTPTPGRPSPGSRTHPRDCLKKKEGQECQRRQLHSHHRRRRRPTVIHIRCHFLPGAHDLLDDDVGLDDAGGPGDLLEQRQSVLLTVGVRDSELLEEVQPRVVTFVTNRSKVC